ncbi:caspase family protein [Bradyrhizobium sp. INPA03-11B]|uniref:caspase family protein n=1 Tax=Bradyrhizobium sp. INPA03-11B TaxID=418598 RepID=UPI0033903576
MSWLKLSSTAGLLIGMQAGIADAATLQSPTGGPVHALVIGADDYVAERHLKGAVADASDLAGALRKAGVSDLTVLLDRQATRQRVMGTLQQMTADAKPGDLVIISFAGHGAQLPERTPGSNPDGMDEVFVLPGFESAGLGTAERIIDKELHALLQRLEQHGVFTLFVADTCHGGGLVRSVDERATDISYRQASVLRIEADELQPINTPAEAMLDETNFEKLTFLGAVDKNSKAPEVRISGQPTLRGALSYAVARAIEGTAPALIEGGVVNRKRLFEYARQLVSQYSEQRQVITAEPLRSAALIEAPAFRLLAAAPAAGNALQPWKDAPVRIRFAGGPREAVALVTPVTTPFKIVGDREPAELIWDSRSGDVVSDTGSIIVLGAPERDLPGIVDRTRALSALQKLAEARPQTIVLQPNNAVHRNGESVAFEADGVRGRFVVVLNISGNGTVQMLFPRVGENAAFPKGTWRLPLTVSEPFGGDTVVAFVSEQPSPTLLDALYHLDGKKNPARVVELLEQEIKRAPGAKIGMVGLFTAP